MPAWDPNQYLKFGDERTQPCRDLIARIGVDEVQRVIDLGCGPGNSTQIVMACWPSAEIIAMDNSPEMVAVAQQTLQGIHVVSADVAEWSRTENQRFDVVFSNATLHWIADHATLFPRLLDRVTPGGALAVQMPNNFGNPSHRIMREMASSAEWREFFGGDRMPVIHVKDPEFYYDLLAPIAARLDAWETEYLHVMQNAEAIVEWVKGTGLRSFLDALDADSVRQRFLREYLENIRREYPVRSDGKVLFPFRRLFLIAYRRAD
jgi:trans-aconitate 2-methyltransferase